MNNGLEVARQILSDDIRKITLQEARQNVQMSVAEVAGATGVSESTLNEWEKDSSKIELFEFEKICRLYRINIAHVFGGKTEDLLKARAELNTPSSSLIDKAATGTRRLVFLTHIKNKLVRSAFAIQEEPEMYTLENIFSDLMDVVLDISEEESVIVEGIAEKM
jgi:transcriptional regulator with XRE-family HTH domain